MIPDDTMPDPNATTVRLIRKVLELSPEKQWSLLKQLEDPTFFSNSYGERTEVRKTYVNTIEFETKGRKYQGTSQDISAGGMYIRTRESIEVGSTIMLHIPYSNNRQLIKVPAEIVRKDAEGIGVEFLGKEG